MIAMGAMLIATPALADARCENISGDWAGTMKGKFNGSTSMKIKGNCKISWKLPDGRINYCNYKNRNGQVEYSCSLGSRGVVNFVDGKIIMQNKYTAARHGAYTVEVSRVAQ